MSNLSAEIISNYWIRLSLIWRIMQISERVIRLGLLNSSEQTKPGPIIAKIQLTRQRFVHTLFVANKFCLNEQLLNLCFFFVLSSHHWNSLSHRITALRSKIEPVCNSSYVGLWLLNVFFFLREKFILSNSKLLFQPHPHLLLII